MRNLLNARVQHINCPGPCPKCEEIFNRYPGFHVGLKAWFDGVRFLDPSAHASCAGRGKAAQDLLHANGYSRADFGKSAHNYNLALDIFRQMQGGTYFEKPWFENVVGKAVMDHNVAFDSSLTDAFQVVWYGQRGQPFYELPHIEVKDWQALKYPLCTDV